MATATPRKKATPKASNTDYLAELAAISDVRRAVARQESELREQISKVLSDARKSGHSWPELQRAAGLSPEGCRQLATKANLGVLPVPTVGK